MARVRLGFYLGDGHKLGPGKVELLESIRELGSISAAARAHGMAYRHAWEMVDDLNACFDEPVVVTATGGRSGGGARVTPLGEEVIRRFHAMEDAALRAVRRDLAALERRLPPPRRRQSGAS